MEEEAKITKFENKVLGGGLSPAAESNSKTILARSRYSRICLA
jgi:hypothetical protein